MKTNVSKIIKITLAVALIATFAACTQTKTESKTAAPATPAKAEIVYVNIDTLIANYDYAKDVNTRIETKGKEANDDVVAKKTAFQREVGDYQKSAATLSADQRASTEQKLQRKGQEIQAYEQNATAQFQQERGSEQNKLYDKIADFTKTYAKEKGYKLVLTFSKANPTVLYGDPSLEVTGDVVKRLNDLYAKDKK